MADDPDMWIIWLVLAVVLIVCGAVLIKRRPAGWNLVGGIALIVVGLVLGVPILSGM